jgi:excinuclease ABC subunit B
MKFKLKSDYQPAGDQGQAIEALVSGLQKGKENQVLLGVTGSGKTFTVANIIEKTQLPTLIISHNKTLGAQLYQEFKEYFPQNGVGYFVSYYDYYQPEAYMPASDTYIAKEVDINDLIDKLRLEASSNLFSRKDNIIVASVSCIYNIGDPTEYGSYVVEFRPGQIWERKALLERLVDLYYARSEVDFKRGTFRIRGEVVEIWPAYRDTLVVLEFRDRGEGKEELLRVSQRDMYKGKESPLSGFLLYPAKQYVSGGKNHKEVFARIKKDMREQVARFEKAGRLLEANRIEQRVNYDLEMLSEMGYVNGIENYSIYFDGRKKGEPPYTLIDYFNHIYGDQWLCVIDESHVTVPQIGGMHKGDRARKETLIDFGFRLPASFDNRPLRFDEFEERVKKRLFLSATPASWEVKKAKGRVVEQLIRPTGLIDPPISVRPSHNQIPDLLAEILKRKKKGERVLVNTLTKRMAEDLAEYLSDEKNTGEKIKVTYLHADVDTLERTEILDGLRRGDYEVLVGINLLREGLDLPEVSLVAILDAGMAGFLRSRSSLIQIMGRAARHVEGEVILYTDERSMGLQEAIDEVERRRKIQLAYNRKHGITPEGIKKALRPRLIEKEEIIKEEKVDAKELTPEGRKGYVQKLRKQMRQLANDLEFEKAAKIRDEIQKVLKIR